MAPSWMAPAISCMRALPAGWEMTFLAKRPEYPSTAIDEMIANQVMGVKREVTLSKAPYTPKKNGERFPESPLQKNEAKPRGLGLVSAALILLFNDALVQCLEVFNAFYMVMGGA